MSLRKLLLLTFGLLTPNFSCLKAALEDEKDHVTSRPVTIEPSIVDKLRLVIGGVMRQLPPSLAIKLMETEISASCSLGLMKMMNGLTNLDPWVVRCKHLFRLL